MFWSSKQVIDLNKQNPNIIVILGHPGAGKGTCASSLKNKGFNHISIGDYLRNELQNNSDIGLRWKKEIEEHGILATKVVKEVTKNCINEINNAAGKYILDGHIRTKDQAEYLDKLLSHFTNIKAFFVLIDTDKELAVSRIPQRRTCNDCGLIYNLETVKPKVENTCDKCQKSLTHRNTDNLINAKNRVETYESHLNEVISYYRKKGVLIEIDGNKSIEQYLKKCQSLFNLSD